MIFSTCDNDKDSVHTRQNVHLNSKILKFSSDFVCSISKEIVRSTHKSLTYRNKHSQRDIGAFIIYQRVT